MSEYIKREDVLSLINSSMFDLEFYAENIAMQKAVKLIPAADVYERKTGKWIEIKRNDVNPITGKCGIYVGCSECGAPLPTDNQLDFIDESDCKFCYNCGVRMEDVDNV